MFQEAVEIIKDLNKDAAIITTPLAMLSAEQLVDAFNKGKLEEEMLKEAMHEHEEHEREHEHEHHHHDHDEDEHEHHHHHDHDEEEHEHHHHHDHDEEEHEHHHDHDEDGHEHHHHHHADEAFTSWGFETPALYEKSEIEEILKALDGGEYGAILRAKGMVNSASGEWVYFDYVPEEYDVRGGQPCYTGKICVIGAELKEERLAELFKK